MFINPKTAIAEGWITHPEVSTIDEWNERKFISPNAIDFTLDRLFSINHQNGFHISEDGKKMRGGEEMQPIVDRGDGPDYWMLAGNSVYDAMSNIYVELPEGVAAQLIIRSTFNRNGLFLTSGLYDSGFKGHIGFAIHNRSGVAYVTPGTRVGQIIFTSSDSAGTYAGGWNHEQGTHHSDGQMTGGIIQDGDGPKLEKQ